MSTAGAFEVTFRVLSQKNMTGDNVSCKNWYLLGKKKFKPLPQNRILVPHIRGVITANKNKVWDFVMLFGNVVFNVFTGVLDATNCAQPALDHVRQNVAVVFVALVFDYLSRIMFSALTILFCIYILHCSVWCYANCDSIIRVSNYVLLNPGLQRA